METEEKRYWHERLHRFATFDEINIRTVPRFKESGASGDEWRHSAKVEFKFKGVLIRERDFGNVQAAVMGLGGELLRAGDEGVPNRVIELEKTKCDQPSCAHDAVVWLALKVRTTSDGHIIPAGDNEPVYYRQFCEAHRHRGDASIDDCDSNYTEIPRPLSRPRRVNPEIGAAPTFD